MQSAIKVGDVYIVYDNNQVEEKSTAYKIGLGLAYYYKQAQKWLTKAKTKSKPVLKTLNLRVKNYSAYDLPTVYRKWR